MSSTEHIPSSTNRVHKDRIARVLDHIFSHRNDNLTTDTLAKVAHYSPFHLQKLFKKHIGQTPRQYILQLKLETAFHCLIVDKEKSIQSIGFDCGFSSPSVFSRAVRDQYGCSPEQIRILPYRTQMQLLHGQTNSCITPMADRPAGLSTSAIARPDISVVLKEPVKGIYLLAPFNQPEAISRAFRELSRFAGANGYPSATMYGIMAPHQRNSYKAVLPIVPRDPSTFPFPSCEIQGGNYARFTVGGNARQVNKAAHHFLFRWLPDSGYKIGGITGFETFHEDPAVFAYSQLRRQIHIPIAPSS